MVIGRGVRENEGGYKLSPPDILYLFSRTETDIVTTK
jgi:hypothetical protein